MKRKIIFLDVDGVLNTHLLRREHTWDHINQGKVSILKRIIDASNAEIVLSSTWRIDPKNQRMVTEALQQQGLNYIDSTADHAGYSPRVVEINEWLEKNPDVVQFAIIDDWADAGKSERMFNSADNIYDCVDLSHSFFKTSDDFGLTDEIADQIIKHLA